jgi:predicted DNA-binding WGR domain protein
MMLPSVHLENRTPPHHKFYKIAVTKAGGGYSVVFSYGKIGTPGVSGTKTPLPLTHYNGAVAVFDGLKDEKLAKGYKVVSEGFDDSSVKPILVMPPPKPDLPKGNPHKKTKKPEKPDDDEPPEKRYRSIVL